ncbi:MAG: DUF86 domain-containing protein [Bacteroidetes bacterium]|nr:DUF86 domain-containing protein [Bacteroidota bacterium]
MQLDIQKYLYDIQRSIDSINEYLGENRNFKEYKANRLLRRGIERELEIIGEAVNRIIKSDPGIKLDNARKIVDLRNWVIHSYDNVDDVIIWGIISKQLPILLAQVKELLKNNKP